MHVRGYKEKGNIDTPLELAIRNEADRYSLAIVAIDNLSDHLGNKVCFMMCYFGGICFADDHVQGSDVREKLKNEQIKSQNYVYETGMDPDSFTNWTFPYS